MLPAVEELWKYKLSKPWHPTHSGRGERMDTDKKEDLLRPVIPVGMRADGTIVPDPLGSYTGLPEDPDEQPVQDADDL